MIGDLIGRSTLELAQGFGLVTSSRELGGVWARRLDKVTPTAPPTGCGIRPVMRRMATALNSVAGVSAASEAFRKCSADLIRGIQDPELLAWELYSDDVVSETVVDEVSVVGLSSVRRKTRLLSAVRDQIAVNPAKFQNLLLALRKHPPLKDIAEKLETIYNNCGMYTATPHI